MRRREPFPGDLLTSILVAVLAAVLLLVPLLSTLTFRTQALYLLILLLFGYTAIAALFPAREDLDGRERLALTLGLSLFAMVLVGLVSRFTPWLKEAAPIAVALAVVTVLLAILAHFRRIELPRRRRFYPGSVPGGLRSMKQDSPIDMARRMALPALLALVMVVVVSVIAYVVTMPDGEEGFTDLYVLGGTDGIKVTAGKVGTISVGIANHEGRTINYTLQLAFGDFILSKRYVKIEDNQTWENPLGYVLEEPGSGQEIAILLFKENDLSSPYKDRRLLVDVSEPHVETPVVDQSPEIGSAPEVNISGGDDALSPSTEEISPTTESPAKSKAKSTGISFGGGGSSSATSKNTAFPEAQPSSRIAEEVKDEEIKAVDVDETSVDVNPSHEEKDLTITGIPETELMVSNEAKDLADESASAQGSSQPITEEVDKGGDHGDEADAPQEFHVSKDNIWTLPSIEKEGKIKDVASPEAAETESTDSGLSRAGISDEADSSAGAGGLSGGGVESSGLEAADQGTGDESESPGSSKGSELESKDVSSPVSEGSKEGGGDGDGISKTSSSAPSEEGAGKASGESSWLESSEIDREIDRLMSSRSSKDKDAGKSFETESIQVVEGDSSGYAVLGKKEIAPVRVGK